MEAAQLQGAWQATVAGHTDAVRLHLGPHPEWKGMVKGEALRNGSAAAPVRTAMVGDVDHGNVTLEESANGTNISATWWGEVVDGSCAREIRGQYQEGDDAPAQPFVLRKSQP